MGMSSESVSTLFIYRRCRGRWRSVYCSGAICFSRFPCLFNVLGSVHGGVVLRPQQKYPAFLLFFKSRSTNKHCTRLRCAGGSTTSGHRTNANARLASRIMFTTLSTVQYTINSVLSAFISKKVSPVLARGWSLSRIMGWFTASILARLRHNASIFCRHRYKWSRSRSRSSLGRALLEKKKGPPKSPFSRSRT